jgi:acetyl esterase/lipase
MDARTVSVGAVMTPRRLRQFTVLVCALVALAVVSCTTTPTAPKAAASAPSTSLRAGPSTSPRASGVRTEAYDAKLYQNIPYIEGPEADGRHKLDLYQPISRNDGKPIQHAPVLMYVHGGAWQFGSKRFVSHIGRTFGKEGYLTACINYRLSPKANHPDHIRDVAHAFDWLKEHAAEYGGDASDFFIAGHSAGGHLVALLATNKKYLREVGHNVNEIAGVIAISGLYRVSATSWVFEGFEPKEPELIDASPEYHVDGTEPPFLLMYAAEDLPLLDAQAIGMERALHAKGVRVRKLRIPERGHVSVFMKIGAHGDPTTAEMLRFLRENDRNPNSAARLPVPK